MNNEKRDYTHSSIPQNKTIFNTTFLNFHACRDGKVVSARLRLCFAVTIIFFTYPALLYCTPRVRCAGLVMLLEEKARK